MENKFYDFDPSVDTDKRTNLEIDLLLEAVFTLSGFDFRQYVRKSIYRRICNRMQLSHIPTISKLIEKVIHEDGFLELLLNDFSINVTEMFRNPTFFKSIREHVIPELKKFPEIRIWHAGCATGEEVLSMSILLHEEGLSEKSVIYATDMNKNVLEKAKQGILPLNKMQTYTKNYLQAGGTQSFSKYYSTDNRFAYFHPSLLQNIIFAQHNLVTDQSFNEFHIILCRNVLIYFTSKLQNQVQQLFYESLGHNGFLCLGNKETLRFSDIMPHYIRFHPNEQIYQKIH